jgi:hypothetical protein
MTDRLIELAERRARLVARAAIQRDDLLQILSSWRSPLAMADQGLLVVHYIRSYAGLVADVATFLAPLRSWRIAKWVRRGWLVWRMSRAVKRIIFRP